MYYTYSRYPKIRPCSKGERCQLPYLGNKGSLLLKLTIFYCTVMDTAGSRHEPPSGLLPKRISDHKSFTLISVGLDSNSDDKPNVTYFIVPVQIPEHKFHSHLRFCQTFTPLFNHEKQVRGRNMGNADLRVHPSSFLLHSYLLANRLSVHFYSRLICFKSVYVLASIHEGFRFPRTYDKLHPVTHVRGTEIQWNLGALVHILK